MMKLKVIVILTICLVFANVSFAQEKTAAKKEMAVLILSSSYVRGLSTLDGTFRQKMENLGYTLNVYGATYSDVVQGNVDLGKFNVIVMYYPPGEGAIELRRIFKETAPIIGDYVKNGGGLFMFGDENGNSYLALNDFVSTFGAEVLPETVVDPAKVFRQKSYLLEYFCTTDNIAEHPITKGIKTLTYPLAWGPEGSGATCALKVDDNWQVIICGTDEAYSISFKAHETGKKTYTTAPPILAARTIGKGRIVLFPTRSLNYLHHGYDRIYEGICLDDGDGFRLMVNILNWLAEPALSSGELGGYIEERKPIATRKKLTKEFFDTIEDVYPHLIKAGRRPFRTEIEHTPKQQRNDYVGVIGVYTTYSKGYASVKEFCDEAKTLDYDYIVFTDDFEYMDEGKWEKLVEDCAVNSDEKFTAIPGIELKDVLGQMLYVFNLPQWIKPDWLDSTGKYLQNAPGMYFGLDWVPTAYVNNVTNYNPPFTNKFYSCLEVFSYFQGNRSAGNVLNWYQQCQANEYNLMPISCHRIYAPEQMEEIIGFKTHVLTDSVEKIPQEFKYHGYSPSTVYISEGPQIREFALANGRGAYREELWKLYIDVVSETPLKEVTVFDRKSVFRRFAPNETHFKTVIAGYHDKQRHFTLIAVDEQGNRVISPALYASDIRQSTYMCTDLQNTLNCMYNLDSNGKVMYYGVQGVYVTSWSGIAPGFLAPENEILPRSGIERGYAGWAGSADHSIPMIESSVSQRDMVFDSGDCNILDNIQNTTLLPYKGGVISPTKYADSRARYISFTPRPYSLNPMVVESEVTFKKDIALPDVPDPELEVLYIGLRPESFPQYSIRNPERQKIKGLRESLTVPLIGSLEKNGFLAAYPDFWGSFAVVALNSDVTYALSRGDFRMGFDWPNRTVVKGEKVLSDYLVIRGAFGESSDEEYDNFWDVYGFDGTPAYSVNLEKGKILDQRFILKLDAENYITKGTISQTNLPNDLGITVSGLCDNWDAGMLEADDNNLRRIGTLDGTGYIAWNVNNRDRSFIIGNVVLCDNVDIKLSLIKENGHYTIYAHNPTENAVTVTIEIPAWLEKAVSSYKKLFQIPAYSTIIFIVD